MPPPPPRTALILSAGGVRGAYQVGVIAGIIDVLGPRPDDAPLFDTFTGASIGSLNATYLAANADRGDHGIDGLIEIWTKLVLEETLRFAPLGLWGWPRIRMPRDHDPMGWSRYVGRSLVDPRPVERLLERVIPWDRLHANIHARTVRALMLPALDICDGATTVFTELAAGVPFRPYPYLATRSLFTAINAEHVLAATALPFVFPARKIDGRYYMDGAIRFETPIIPALRAGARRAVAISLLHETSGHRDLVFPGVLFLAGQLLSGALLDPLRHDINTLERNNRIVEVLAETLDPPMNAEVVANLESEVPPGRDIPTLVFRPSEDMELITAEFLRHKFGRCRPLRRALLRWLATYETGHALLASFLLFDGRLAARLIELGRRDAHAAEEQILALFSD
ncbi:MAG: patatin-like phospholipase family protein [Enhygromyxa sp.]